MSTIVEFSVPSEAFLLGETLRRTPEMVIEIERVVAHGDERVTPFFWISAGDYEAFGSTVHDDPSVDDVELIEEHEEARLYRANWTPIDRGVVDAYRDVDAVILAATGQGDRWRLRLRFVDRDQVGEFLARCSRRGVPVGLRRAYDSEEPHAGGLFELTPIQLETLRAALDAGYYERPRAISHAELAEGLGVSQQAVSDRLRRAHGNLVRGALSAGTRETVETANSGEARVGRAPGRRDERRRGGRDGIGARCLARRPPERRGREGG